MPETEINLTLIGNDRKTIKDNLIKEFLKENPGTGSGDLASTYYYYVESTLDGIQIYLKRPARLNKGMDFEVHAEEIKFENESNSGRITRTTRPSHSTILYDLEIKKGENDSEYAKVLSLIERLYSCQDVKDQEMRELKFAKGHPIELILKTIKWLLIEQDVTYWNWSGREMFYKKIGDI